VNAGEAGPNWAQYYQAVRHEPPRETLVQALDLFAGDEFAADEFAADEPARQRRFAVDLGCGTGMDTFTLLQRGWRVLALDGQPEAIDHVRQGTPPEVAGLLETRVVTFEELAEEGLPAADLVNASFSLPFCRPHAFDALWAKIVTALRPGGRFAGQFFGPHDTWANNPALTFHSRAAVDQLLTSFEVERFREEDEDGKMASGQLKHWHVFWIVARKRD
jgi:SAM-dependent methyltransferase